MHSCDVQACVNPGHLRIGTHADNHADCVAKGRYPKGTDYSSAKMTESNVRKMRWMRETKRLTYSALGKAFRISQTQARAICIRKDWVHVA